jgi:sulfur relay (sulfurtransferase) DsrC/TusE family protein
MNLKELPANINSQTVKQFLKLLSDNKESLLTDKKIKTELFNLKNFLLQIEDYEVEVRSTIASKALSEMTEEERRMLSMAPDEKKFFLEYKIKNPTNPWTYFKEYQKKVQKEYRAAQKQLA